MHSDEKFEKINVEQLKQAKAAILDKKSLLLVTDSVTALDVTIPNLEIVVKSEDELISLLRKKEPAALQFLRKGTVLSGEDKVVEIIKNCVSRF